MAEYRIIIKYSICCSASHFYFTQFNVYIVKLCQLAVYHDAVTTDLAMQREGIPDSYQQTLHRTRSDPSISRLLPLE